MKTKKTAHTMLALLAASLLNDDNGISGESYDLLLEALGEAGVPVPAFFREVEATDGRFYLPARK